MVALHKQTTINTRQHSTEFEYLAESFLKNRRALVFQKGIVSSFFGPQRKSFLLKTILYQLIAVIFMLLTASACQTGTPELQDGYYTAEAASFDSQGWKEFMTIYVNQDKIVTIEYNAKNASGFIRSWDMNNMRRMNAKTGTYHNKYARIYATALLSRQNPALISAAPGAAKPLKSFVLLAEASIAQAKKGDKTVSFVDLSYD